MSIRGACADLLSDVVEAFLSRPCAGTLRDLVLWPKAISGTVPVCEEAMFASAIAQVVSVRVQKWGSGKRSGLWEEISEEGTCKSGKKGKVKRGGGATVTREDEESKLEGGGLSQEDKEK